ncbi:hypothetical protein LEP1GSC038_0658 [Leptospira weilii str. 2006001855]|uniref:Uncharacterized protein n=1 Tax=Leptospira weilii str. 2006001855 TaxID=996804 RepID=M6FM00_9LEPT|nr:hypothetical protein LEP1GSC038_0658 [Leptospira weilii str. 2006001855]
MILDGIFGNRTASRVLLHLYHYNEIHSSAIAADYGTAVTRLDFSLSALRKRELLSQETLVDQEFLHLIQSLPL